MRVRDCLERRASSRLDRNFPFNLAEAVPGAPFGANHERHEKSGGLTRIYTERQGFFTDRNQADNF
jgi:hypothetical protein